MSLFPTDDKGRKMLPIWKMQTRYFPKALREITRVCVANNVRYNPDREPADINWARGKSKDQLGSAYRHMMESEVDGLVFEAVSAEVTAATGIDKVYVLAEAAWRLLAALELTIEAQEAHIADTQPTFREKLADAVRRHETAVIARDLSRCLAPMAPPPGLVIAHTVEFAPGGVPLPGACQAVGCASNDPSFTAFAGPVAPTPVCSVCLREHPTGACGDGL